jgi:hypothetical protein
MAAVRTATPYAPLIENRDGDIVVTLPWGHSGHGDQFYI